MPAHTIHDTVEFLSAIPPIADLLNVDTASISTILDTQGFESNELVLHMGAITDPDVTFVALMEEGDDSGLSDAAAVADVDLVGTEIEVAPLFGSDDTALSIGYKGNKRYIRFTLTPTGNNAGSIFRSAVWAQSRKRHNI